MNIPPMLSILDRARELRRDMQRQHDKRAVEAYDNLIVGVVCGYDQLRWLDQYLLVASASTYGAIYYVSAVGCTCEARKPCHHQRLRALLLDMFDTEAETADQEAEYRAIAPRIIAARRVCWARL